AGHAEVVQVNFDPSLISYEELLTWFWTLHDPTSINKQGEDEGPEYRSVIYAHSEAHRRAATASRKDVQANTVRPIVTSIEASSVFYPAAENHQDYYARNKANAQCQTVIGPHLEAIGLEK
ncbi:MAG: peptide-methionine (S)-S-oxide reductase MsrA, partial [Planctomycetota bacterium]|nr:peptide-methionine (S)-S-oxide reductase MsrA [Planctomycetota bacterium]